MTSLTGHAADAEILFIPNREVRAFPKGWQHPCGPEGDAIPLLPHDYYGDWDGNGTAPMPWPAGETEIAAYETTSEGTPLSPAFPDTPEGRLALVNWCAANATTFGPHRSGPEAWAALLFGDAVITPDGSVVAQG